jgi:hypothetical protein
MPVEVALINDMLQRNYRILLRQAEGLTHEDSLRQLPFRGNCFNWVIGHILQSRDKMLQLVQQPRVWTDAQVARYDRESEPIISGEDALLFETMLHDLTTGHERLTERLAALAPAELDQLAPKLIQGIPDWSIGQFLHFLLWHETYHVGQTEFLRQLTGKNDKVI